MGASVIVELFTSGDRCDDCGTGGGRYHCGARRPCSGCQSIWVLWKGMSWVSVYVMLGYRAVMRRRLVTYYASCVPPARGGGGPFRCE